MRYEYILLAAIFLPICGAFILPLAGRLSVRFRNLFALGLVLSSFVLSAMLLAPVLSGVKVTISKELLLSFNISFVADSLAVFMALISSLVSAIIILYSFGYISHYGNQNEYYSMVVLFLGAMIGLVYSANLILLYIFWEITAVTSWRLIGFFRKSLYILKAEKAFLVTFFGSLLMLLGFISIYQQSGSFDLKAAPISNLAVLLILAGIFSKSATLPFHTWLPDAGVAPAPVTALLHAAILVKIGTYVFARLFLGTFTIAQFWHTAVPIIAAMSALISAGAAFIETDLKRLLAYSTVSQIGFIFFGLAIANPISVAGSLLFILMHGIAKAGLFLCAGIIEQNTKTKDITKLGGLFGSMPVTAASFLFCAASVMGIPAFGGFFCKYMVFSGAVRAGQFGTGFLFLIAAFMTILYLFRAFNLIFLGEAQLAKIKEQSPLMVATVAILALLSLFSGILIHYPSGFVRTVVTNMPAMLK